MPMGLFDKDHLNLKGRWPFSAPFSVKNSGYTSASGNGLCDTGRRYKHTDSAHGHGTPDLEGGPSNLSKMNQLLHSQNNAKPNFLRLDSTGQTASTASDDFSCMTSSEETLKNIHKNATENNWINTIFPVQSVTQSNMNGWTGKTPMPMARLPQTQMNLSRLYPQSGSLPGNFVQQANYNMYNSGASRFQLPSYFPSVKSSVGTVPWSCAAALQQNNLYYQSHPQPMDYYSVPYPSVGAHGYGHQQRQMTHPNVNYSSPYNSAFNYSPGVHNSHKPSSKRGKHSSSKRKNKKAKHINVKDKDSVFSAVTNNPKTADFTSTVDVDSNLMKTTKVDASSSDMFITHNAMSGEMDNLSMASVSVSPDSVMKELPDTPDTVCSLDSASCENKGEIEECIKQKDTISEQTISDLANKLDSFSFIVKRLEVTGKQPNDKTTDNDVSVSPPNSILNNCSINHVSYEKSTPPPQFTKCDKKKKKKSRPSAQKRRRLKQQRDTTHEVNVHVLDNEKSVPRKTINFTVETSRCGPTSISPSSRTAAVVVGVGSSPPQCGTSKISFLVSASEFESDSDSDWDDTTHSGTDDWSSELAEQFDFCEPLMFHVSFKCFSSSEVSHPQTNTSETKHTDFDDIDPSTGKIDKETTCGDVALKTSEANSKWLNFYGGGLSQDETITSHQKVGALACIHPCDN